MDVCIAEVAHAAAPPTIGSLLEAVTALLPAMQTRAAFHDMAASFPETDVAELRAAGALAAPVPRVFGGLGLGTEATGAPDLARLLRLVGRGNLVVGRVYEGHVNALRLVMRHGAPAQVRAAVADALAGELFAVWNTQASDAPLVLDGDRLHGAKVLATAAGHATRALVTADLPDGARQMILVRLAPGERADLSEWTARGMRGSATGRVTFDGMRAPASALIGGPDDYIRQPDFSGGAWRVLAVLAGGLDGLVEAFRTHLVGRRRDGDPHQQARAGRLFALQNTVRLWVTQAADIAEAGADDALIVAFTDLARGAVEAACVEAVSLVERSVGLHAFMRPEPVERITRDLETYLRQPAPDAALTGAARYFLRAALP
ncbi:acyl-CoA dehydrogenase family protein [Acidisphaera rubrifaciens]|uniref:Acyl-CoA dehydrogenase n=1 Tax=Acidisphaera rubrifaciens HS-AP3 TaxID=1231350 RepID=A0A0D6P6W6_9PROT|nr:acyl-CoA dehydrogenase family protein [Acidisphaera rubrifaciens]GAN77086.1 acyl-CoA dehydrogenase [Acidisphaera rubrifaciens HS-AP3]